MLKENWAWYNDINKNGYFFGIYYILGTMLYTLNIIASPTFEPQYL